MDDDDDPLLSFTVLFFLVTSIPYYFIFRIRNPEAKWIFVIAYSFLQLKTIITNFVREREREAYIRERIRSS